MAFGRVIFEAANARLRRRQYHELLAGHRYDEPWIHANRRLLLLRRSMLLVARQSEFSDNGSAYSPTSGY